jgi:hypothetical protein
MHQSGRRSVTDCMNEEGPHNNTTSPFKRMEYKVPRAAFRVCPAWAVKRLFEFGPSPQDVSTSRYFQLPTAVRGFCGVEEPTTSPHRRPRLLPLSQSYRTKSDMIGLLLAYHGFCVSGWLRPWGWQLDVKVCANTSPIRSFNFRII